VITVGDSNECATGTRAAIRGRASNFPNHSSGIEECRQSMRPAGRSFAKSKRKQGAGGTKSVRNWAAISVLLERGRVLRRDTRKLLQLLRKTSEEITTLEGTQPLRGNPLSPVQFPPGREAKAITGIENEI
jgi:hypothetical protein